MTPRRELPHASGRDSDRTVRSGAAAPCAPARMGRDGASRGARGAVYNELDAYPAEWLRNLIAAGHIAPGVVDERSITDLRATDLAGVVQFHAFAGIGVWSHALRLAGWPDDRPVWTVSCPCQPFSAAGKRGGFDDERHLWPVWFELARECHPPVILGEQVASGDGLAWFDAVSADLEGAGYAVGAFDLCAAGFGAPHIRQRLYFVAYADVGNEREQVPELARRKVADAPRGRGPCAMGDADDIGAGRDRGAASREEAQGSRVGGDHRGIGDVTRAPGPGAWDDVEWLPCADGKSRPTQPGIHPLAHGATQRVGRLRAYGNAIVAPQAAAFIRAVMDVLDIDLARALATWDASAVACGWRGEVP